jgi:hypothetical protein
VICYQHVLDNEKCDYAYSPKAVLTSGGIWIACVLIIVR